MAETRRNPFPSLSITASQAAGRVTITLVENLLTAPYQRTYTVELDQTDDVKLPNDLNAPTQNILRAVAIKFNHPNTYAGDS